MKSKTTTSPTPPQTFGTFIRSLRKRLGLTQAEAAEVVKISPSYLAQLELGIRNPPSREIIGRFAIAYLIEEDVLLREGGYPEDAKTKITPERIEWAFKAMCSDPNFRYGHAVRHKALDLDTKALLAEIYGECTHRNLFQEEESNLVRSLHSIDCSRTPAGDGISREIEDTLQLVRKATRSK
jgi:transcriptional regulator with XRE-family HTH domain